jgi:DNA modification methylase
MFVNLFKSLERTVDKRGVVLLNLSYSSRNAGLPYHVITGVEKSTLWKVRDTICWKKPIAVPQNTSPRNMTRIIEMVFVFSMDLLFITNKPVASINERTRQKFYRNITNFVEARGYDPETRKHNKATFSVEFASKLIEMYFPKGSIVLDPFCGTGTTGVACKETGRHFIMIDISQQYVDYARERVGLCKKKRVIRENDRSIMDFFKKARIKKE